MSMKFSRIARVALAAATLGGVTSVALAGAFTANNVVVLRIGDGTTALSNIAPSPVFLDEYTPTGTFVQTIALPAANFGLPGNESAIGALALSTDGQYLTFGVYDTTSTPIVPTAGNITTSNPAVHPRVIVRVDAAGNVDTSTQITDGFNRFASVITDDGTRFWATGNDSAVIAGNDGGMRFSASLGATTSTSVVTGAGLPTPNNLLFAGIYSGQLHTAISFSTQIGVSRVGTGIPTTSGQSVALLPGMFTGGTHGPKAFLFADTNTLYQVDTQTTANGGGLQRWTFNGTNWVLAGTFISPTDATNGGLCGLGGGDITGSTVTLYVTSVRATGGSTNANSLIKYVSTDGGVTFPTVTILLDSPNGGSATTQSFFRGVAMAPGSVVPVELSGFELE